MPAHHRPRTASTSGLIARALGAAALFVVAAAGAASEQPDPAELERLKARIAELSRELAQRRGEHAEALRALRRVERAIGRIGRALERIDAERAATRAALRHLRTQRRALERRLRRQREALGRAMRSAYLMGREAQIRLLLNQEDPWAVGRALVYHRYVARARLERITAVRASLAALADVRARMAAEDARLARLRAARAAEAARLAAERTERERLLAAIAARLRAGEARLERLRRDRAALERLLSEVERAVEALPRAPGARPFRELRGALPWPARGRLLARYGARRSGGLRWRGVLIGAPAGRAVRAVSHGRVVFADWLRGLGLLLIIDHGDGWMTLYGHNRSLYKEVGDWVEAGEVIASVGDSGGRERAALYFEIRHRGRPVDPVRWCRGTPARPRG